MYALQLYAIFFFKAKNVIHFVSAITECARDRGPYEVKNACRGTQMNAGIWSWALYFGEFQWFEQYKEASTYYRFNIFAYEGHNPWHTR